MSSPTRYDAERAIKGSDLPPVERHLLLTLCTYMDQGSTVIPARYTPSLTRLERITGWSLRTIKRHLTVLEKGGWLVRARTPGKRTHYTVTYPHPEPSRGTQPPPLGAVSPATRGTQPSIQTSPDCDPEITIVAEEIRMRTGKTISDDGAAAARDFILARPRLADDPRSREAYLRKTIRQDREPARFLPTPTPPKFTREKGFQ